ncbi:hypothetical protein PENSPDRAFT_751850 [Peniophora sp. CONT]|nr:hypothetical protein PENSPDRAFT_751850 [Peniophora sp. CONT]
MAPKRSHPATASGGQEVVEPDSAQLYKEERRKRKKLRVEHKELEVAYDTQRKEGALREKLIASLQEKLAARVLNEGSDGGDGGTPSKHGLRGVSASDLEVLHLGKDAAVNLRWDPPRAAWVRLCMLLGSPDAEEFDGGDDDDETEVDPNEALIQKCAQLFYEHIPHALRSRSKRQGGSTNGLQYKRGHKSILTISISNARRFLPLIFEGSLGNLLLRTKPEAYSRVPEIQAALSGDNFLYSGGDRALHERLLRNSCIINTLRIINNGVMSVNNDGRHDAHSRATNSELWHRTKVTDPSLCLAGSICFALLKGASRFSPVTIGGDQTVVDLRQFSDDLMAQLDRIRKDLPDVYARLHRGWDKDVALEKQRKNGEDTLVYKCRAKPFHPGHGLDGSEPPCIWQGPNEPTRMLEVSKVHTRGQLGSFMMHLILNADSIGDTTAYLPAPDSSVKADSGLWSSWAAKEPARRQTLSDCIDLLREMCRTRNEIDKTVIPEELNHVSVLNFTFWEYEGMRSDDCKVGQFLTGPLVPLDEVQEASDAPQALRDVFGALAHWYHKVDEDCIIDAIQYRVCNSDIEIVSFKTCGAGHSRWFDSDDGEDYNRASAAHECTAFCASLSKAFAAIQLEKEAEKAEKEAELQRQTEEAVAAGAPSS